MQIVTNTGKILELAPNDFPIKAEIDTMGGTQRYLIVRTKNFGIATILEPIGYEKIIKKYYKNGKQAIDK